jgi:hypothetical protein
LRLVIVLGGVLSPTAQDTNVSAGKDNIPIKKRYKPLICLISDILYSYKI